MDILRSYKPDYVLILAGDHVYKMDYGEMLASHVRNQADMTVACLEVPIEEAKSFGVMSVNEEDRVVSFSEKPLVPTPIPGHTDRALASMGIYVFNTAFMLEQLIRDADDRKSSHDFGKDIIPYLVPRYRVFAHRFADSCVGSPKGEEPYWRDVGTVDAYWAANLDLASVTPALNLYDEDWPIWTYQEQLPPAKFVFDEDDRRGMAVDTMVSGGCVISGASVRRSVLFSNVKVNSYARLEEAVVLPDVHISRHVRLRKVVVDKGCRIPEGLVVGEDPIEDAKRFYLSPGGVVLITPQMLGQNIHQFR